jgi:hypothetical protein
MLAFLFVFLLSTHQASKTAYSLSQGKHRHTVEHDEHAELAKTTTMAANLERFWSLVATLPTP